MENRGKTSAENLRVDDRLRPHIARRFTPAGFSFHDPQAISLCKPFRRGDDVLTIEDWCTADTHAGAPWPLLNSTRPKSQSESSRELSCAGIKACRFTPGGLLS